MAVSIIECSSLWVNFILGLALKLRLNASWFLGVGVNYISAAIKPGISCTKNKTNAQSQFKAKRSKRKRNLGSSLLLFLFLSRPFFPLDRIRVCKWDPVSHCLCFPFFLSCPTELAFYCSTHKYTPSFTRPLCLARLFAEGGSSSLFFARMKWKMKAVRCQTNGRWYISFSRTGPISTSIQCNSISGNKEWVFLQHVRPTGPLTEAIKQIFIGGKNG